MKKKLARFLPKLYGLYFNVWSLFSKQRTAEMAFQVFCTVRKGRVGPSQKPYLDEARHTVESVGNLHLQTYRWSGNSKRVLLVHGWESNTFRWRNLIAKLREADYDIFAFDAPAHGNSTGEILYVPLYADCVQHMIDRFRPHHLIGHSVGGMTLLYNQFKFPNSEIRSIVTLGSPSEFHEILSHYQELLGFNGRVRKAFEAYIKDRFGFEVDEFSSTRFVADLNKKGLLFHDETDTLAPFHASESVHAHWKGSRFIATQGLGHSLHQEHINDEILAFLAS